MENYDRIERLIKGESIDRVPVIPHMEAFAGKICNVSTEEFYLNPKTSYDCQVWSKELFKYDGGHGYDIPYGYVEEFGGKIEFPKGEFLSFPRIVERPVKTKNDVDKLVINKDCNGFLSSRLEEFNRITFEKGEGVYVSGGSPLNIVQAILGIDTLMRWTIKEKDLLHRVIRFSTDYLLYMAEKAVKEYGAENVSSGFACPVECHGLMSSKTFEKFSLPYLKEIYDKYNEMGINIDSVHLCGDHKNNLSYWKNDIGLKDRTIITVGTEFDLVELSKEMSDRYIIGGHLKNVTLQTGKPVDVYNEARELIESMKGFKGGYILTPDCTLSFLTPSANLYAMVKAAEDFGKY
ncbi:MAG: uroporphyrinogen decarboxylase family protein [Clostridium sp.]